MQHWRAECSRKAPKSAGFSLSSVDDEPGKLGTRLAYSVRHAPGGGGWALATAQKNGTQPLRISAKLRWRRGLLDAQGRNPGRVPGMGVHHN